MSLHEHNRRVERHGGDSAYPPTNTPPLCCAGGQGILLYKPCSGIGTEVSDPLGNLRHVPLGGPRGQVLDSSANP